MGPTPGAAESWRAGRERYAVWALRVSTPAVLARAAAIAERLGDAIVPVPAHDAHVTAWVCGFPTAQPSRDDDVAEAVLAEQCRHMDGVGGTRLTVGAVNAFATCVFLEVEDPSGALADVRRKLSVPGAREIRFAPYLPHLTVGRFVDTRPAGALAATLEELRRGPHATPLTAVDASLALLELDARAPERMRVVWPATAAALYSSDAPTARAGDQSRSRTQPARSSDSG